MIEATTPKGKKPQQVHVWTLPDWKNPYDPEHRHRSYPEASRAQRLATCMRVLGRPLSIMKKWPEVLAMRGGSETVALKSKAEDMAEQKAVAAHRAALEKSIEKLAARRDIVKAELDELESELKLLLSMLKAAGAAPGEALAKIEVEVSEKKRKGKKSKETNGHTPKAGGASTVLKLLAKKGSTLTPETLAAETGQNNVAASQMLGKLARDGVIARVSRGVYGAVS